jgi:hypothetical protein
VLKYRELLHHALLNARTGVFGCVLIAATALAGLVLVLGGSLAGAARTLVNLGIWTLIAVQTVSQASPPTAVALPPLMRLSFRSLQALQLQGIVLAPACTGEGGWGACSALAVFFTYVVRVPCRRRVRLHS